MAPRAGRVVSRSGPSTASLPSRDLGDHERILAVVVGLDPGADQDVVLPFVLAGLLVAVDGDEGDLHGEVEPAGDLQPAADRRRTRSRGCRSCEPLRKTLKSRSLARHCHAPAGSMRHRPRTPPPTSATAAAGWPMRSGDASSSRSSLIGFAQSAGRPLHRNRAAAARFRAFPRSARPCAAGGPRRHSVDHLPDRRPLAREHGLDRAVRPIAHPAVEPEAPRLAHGPGPKPNPLHLTVNSHAYREVSTVSVTRRSALPVAACTADHRCRLLVRAARAGQIAVCVTDPRPSMPPYGSTSGAHACDDDR